jgi:putative oxidoreductase
MRALERLLQSPWLVGLCRIGVGIVFVVAALSKIGDPAAFATQIHHFRIAPIATEHLIALTLPWVELLAGLGLVLDVRARAGAWLSAAMMAAFTLMVASAMARHLDFECGCFGTADATRVGLKKLLENLALTGAALIAAARTR